MPKALVFNTQNKANIAQQKILDLFAARYATWLDANGAIVGENAATELPEVRSQRTVRWATPLERNDVPGEWWIPAPPRFVLVQYQTQLQSAGARLEDVAESWYPPYPGA